MATPQKPESPTTSDQRSQQLRAAIARRDAVQTLDTFNAPAEPASAVTDSALDGLGLQLEVPGFGDTDTTEISGDASLDQDLAEAAGDVENDEFDAGQAAVDAYRDSKDEQTSALAPPEDYGHKPPAFDDHAGLLSGLGAESAGGGGGSGSAETSGGGDPTVAEGGGGGGATESASIGARLPNDLATGGDAVVAAGGPEADISQLLGDPRELAHQGAGNSAAANSDAVHTALGAVLEEQMHARMGATSVADDGGALAEAIAAADKEAPATTTGPDLSKFQKIGGGMTAEEAEEAAKPGIIEQFLDWMDGDFKMDASSGTLPSRDFTQIDGFGKVDSTTQVEGGQAAGVNNFETSMGKSLGSAKGGGVKDPGSPDETGRRGPPTEAEKALRAATNKLLGRNDALVHGPATEINPGEQGEIFRAAGPAPDAQAQKESMIGQPRQDAPHPSGGEAGQPGVGQGSHLGGDIDFEDGTGYTGQIRHQGPEDVDFGRDEPLVGLDRGEDEDSDDERSGGSVLSRPIFSTVGTELRAANIEPVAGASDNDDDDD